MARDRMIKRREITLTKTEWIFKQRIDEFCQKEGLELPDYTFGPEEAARETSKMGAISEAMREKWGFASLDRAKYESFMADHILKPAIRFLRKKEKEK